MLGATGVAVVLGASLNAATAGAIAPASETVDRPGTLQTSGQSMWQAGAGGGIEEKTFPLFHTGWNASGSGGKIANLETPPIKYCEIFNESIGEDILSALEGKPECADEKEASFEIGKFGAEGSASTKGEVGMSLALHGFASGSVGVEYPVTAHYTIPKADSFAAGDTVTVKTSETVDSGAALHTSFPTLKSAELDGAFGFQAAASFKLCFFSCTKEESIFNLSFPESYDGTNAAKGQIVEVSNPGTECFDFIANFVGGFGHAPEAYSRCRNEKTGVNSGYIGLPNVSTSSTLGSDGTLTATGEDPYVVVPVSAVTWATRVLPDKPPVPLNLGPAEIPGTGVTLGWNTVQLVFTDIEEMQQAFEFKPRVDTMLEWGQRLHYEVKRPGGEMAAEGEASNVTFPLGDTLVLRTPPQIEKSLVVTPRLSMGQATISNHTQNLSIGQGEFSALGLTLETPESSTEILGEKFGIPSTDIKLGPLYRKEFPLATTRNDIVNSSWTLGGFSQPALGDLLLTPDPPPVPTGLTVQPVEGASFEGTLASFADPDTTGKASDYTATVRWGDGSSGTATLVDDGNGVIHAVGTHTYKEEGEYPVDVTIQDVDTENLHVTAHSAAQVADAPLHIAAHTDTTMPGEQLALLWPAPPSSGTLASFTDEDPEGTLSDYAATIQWGDGSASAGTITANGHGGWDVSAAHEYAVLGPHTVTVTVRDEGGSEVSTTMVLLSYAYTSGGGDFAIQPSAVGSGVTFWGARWAAANPLGDSNPSFKGWVDRPGSATPACGAAWSSAPGNSSVPPPSVPSYVAVLETGPVAKRGAVLSGESQGVAVVRVGEGFGPSPGHEGQGEVVGQVPCS